MACCRDGGQQRLRLLRLGRRAAGGGIFLEVGIHLILPVLLAGDVDAGSGAELLAARALGPVHEMVAAGGGGGEGVGGRPVADAAGGHGGRAAGHAHRAVAVGGGVVAVVAEVVVAIRARQPRDGVLRAVGEIDVDVGVVHPRGTTCNTAGQRAVQLHRGMVKEIKIIAVANVQRQGHALVDCQRASV